MKSRNTFILVQPIIEIIIGYSLTSISHGFGYIPNSPCAKHSLSIRRSLPKAKSTAFAYIESSTCLSMDSDAQDAEIIGKSSENDCNDEKTVFQKIDQFGFNLKARAQSANSEAQKVKENETQKVLLSLKSCMLYSAFIIYRGYRGFFVILPAVFQQVYRKMDIALNDPFHEYDEENNVEVPSTRKKAPLRTAVVVTVVSFLVTLSYTITGACKVLAMFVRTVTKTSKVEPAFEAAADEILTNEKKVLKLANEKTSINGEELTP